MIYMNKLWVDKYAPNTMEELVLDEALWLSKEIPHIEIQLIAMMLLSRCFLIRFVKNSLDTTYYDLSVKYIEDTFQHIAKEGRTKCRVRETVKRVLKIQNK